ncbi:MAG: cation transporting ATPase C-terminal domain-containing protein, partial [Candidatus Hydrogenedentes bacterium]|nr:cation transporting ATPase C-terminal domain-containing protein [Candidatus Hydrogenedentota bacterium]
ETVQTMMFTVIVCLQLGNSLAVRSVRDSVFRQGLFTNLPLLGAIVGMLALQVMILYVPFFQSIFNTVPLSAGQLIVSVVLGGALFWAIEFEKWTIRHIFGK